jgi:sugar phosphate isomerase/epimerase
MDHNTTKRGNYESGSDYVLEYGELRFTFNERDFTERVEQAAIKLGFVRGLLESEEREDLVNLAVNGEVIDAASDLGHHINSCWGDLAGPSDRSLVHWLRRLVFRGAWLDQRVKEGELDIVFDPDTHAFGYVQPERDAEPIELSREPSWARLAYRP